VNKLCGQKGKRKEQKEPLRNRIQEEEKISPSTITGEKGSKRSRTR